MHLGRMIASYPSVIARCDFATRRSTLTRIAAPPLEPIGKVSELRGNMPEPRKNPRRLTWRRWTNDNPLMIITLVICGVVMLWAWAVGGHV
jgi:hypothetical protein